MAGAARKHRKTVVLKAGAADSASSTGGQKGTRDGEKSRFHLDRAASLVTMAA